MKPIHIGTSGWHYEHWKGPFYPPDLPNSSLLSYYTDHFHTVEINNSFYRLPEAETFDQWRQSAPVGFIFAVKANRYITHMKKLKDPQQPVANFWERVEKLGDRLGPVLFQLPPRWHMNVERLNAFLDVLPEGNRFAFEFRDASWFDEAVYKALERRGAAFCIFDLNRQVSPKQVTAEYVYVRLHGPGGPYQGRYSTQELNAWASDFSKWASEGKEIYCYFDNDQAGYAVQNAQELRSLVDM